MDLRLSDSSGKEIDNNFYWLSKKQDILDYNLKPHGWYFYTLTSQYADYTALNKLPKITVHYDVTNKKTGKEYTVFTVRLENKSRHIAFFETLTLADKSTGKTILPVLWSDNDVSLLPGEIRLITAKVHNEYLKNKIPVLRVQGYNE